MQLREEFKFDIRQVMRLLPADGKIKHLFRQFTLSPRTEGRARSVKNFAEALGFSVERQALPFGVNGMLKQDPFSDNSYCIVVNEKLSIEAQRFAVLHEMGHYFRHEKHDDPLAYAKYFDLSEAAFYVDKSEEREANEFAEALLFGNGQLVAAHTICLGDISKLAKYFGVTQAVVKVALVKLKTGYGKK
ncbi:ImmA/IrrE family metallo-endopeptidase [Parasulfitobacter algicola]|uniref:ImmA/IrrE family metallo-endopeptidase n=1 Tax=Parasulfitobacter algicola TaxID=2614809 RepID=A0ABX2IRZ3_9RHOB|nr:ImmA/IrrE family metallo-endopeptidase [Sulfitobacter algicola]NSX55668.1 ImmA/IrrE family metallo-endopeptidase [Sulfitobacter algicola]